MDDIILPEVTGSTTPLPKEYNEQSNVIARSTPFQVPHAVTDVEEAKLRKEASKLSTWDVVKQSFKSGGNIGYSLYTDYDRRSMSGPADPTWKSEGFKDWLATNAASIPANQEWRYKLTDSKQDADSLLAQSKDWAQKQKLIAARAIDRPINTFVAAAIPSLIDVDTPAMFLSGGATFAGSRVARIAGGMVAGAATGTALGAAGILSDPNADWASLPLAGLSGMVFGGIGGSFGKANRAAGKVEREFTETAEDGFPNNVDHSTAAMHDDVFQPGHRTEAKADAETDLDGMQPHEERVYGMKDVQPNDSGGSLGARQVNGAQAPLSEIRSTRIQDTIQRAKTWIRSNGVAQEYFDNFSDLNVKYPGIGRVAQRVQDVIHAGFLATDFDRMFRTNSAVAQKLAFDFFESASGIIRNNKNGAALYRMYQQQLHNEFKDLAPRMEAWMRDQNMGVMSRLTNFKKMQEFNEAVISELQYRYHKTGLASTNEHILAAADEVDKWSARDIQVRKGRPGENHEFGTDTMQAKSGYYPQQWLGQKFRQLIESSNGRYRKSHIVEAIDELYAQMHPAMQPTDRKIWAESIVDRASRQGAGLSMNIRSALDGDGRHAVAEMLVRNGANRNDVEALIDRLTGNMETAGQKGNTKRRIDIDLRATASNGIRIMDLIDTDVYATLSRRSHAAAGAGALARKGISSRAELQDYLEAVIQEQGLTSIPKAPGKTGGIIDTLRDNFEHFVDKDKHITMEELQDVFAIFTGRPIEGAISPAVQRMVRLTNLGLLGQLGLTQLAEMGPAMSAVGLRRFMRDLPEDIQHAMKDPTSDLGIELKHMGIMEPEEVLFRYDNVYSAERAATEDHAWLSKADTLLQRASRIQGFTSLMFQVRRVQHKMAVTTGVNRIMQTIKGQGGDFATSLARLRDMGLQDAEINRIKKYIDNGTVQFKDGEVHKLNLKGWKPEDVDDFTASMNRFVDQQVQRAMAGENNSLFRKGGVASLFWHLKQFPMLAIEKQFMRNVRLADDETMGMFFYGLAAGAVAYSVKQAVNGNTDRLNLEDIARGSFNMSNLTGWMPMFIDPTAFLLGFDTPFAGGRREGAVAVPPIYSYLNDLSAVPGAVQRLVNPFVEASNADLKALQAIPVVGRMIGVPFILNALKSDTKPHKKEKPYDPVAQAKAKEKEVNKDQPMFTLDEPGGLLGYLTK